jgi:hypothetical protein
VACQRELTKYLSFVLLAPHVEAGVLSNQSESDAMMIIEKNNRRDIRTKQYLKEQNERSESKESHHHS